MKKILAALLMAQAVVMLSHAPVLGGISITKSDVASWTGGKYLRYTYQNILPGRLSFKIADGAVWDFRDFPFLDTIKTTVRQATSADHVVFPGATHIDIGTPTSLSRFILAEPFAQALRLENDKLSLIGYQVGMAGPYRPDTGWIPCIASILDTPLKLPMARGMAWSSTFQMAPNGLSNACEIRNPLYRSINAEGRIVLPGNDTLMAIGMRVIGSFSSTTITVIDQSYIWFTKEYGITARIDVETDRQAPDTTSFLTDSTVDFSGYDKSVRQFILRIPSPGSSHNVNPSTYRYAAGAPKRSGESSRSSYNAQGRRLWDVGLSSAQWIASVWVAMTNNAQHSVSGEERRVYPLRAQAHD